MTASTKSLRLADTGATAIEYAIIGALIGIGLIGSLVGTKTSLNAVFGTVSTQIGSTSSGGTAGPTLSPAVAQRSSYWAAKGLVSKTVNGTTTTYNYADGSTASLTRDSDAQSPSRLTSMDTQTHLRETIYLDPNGIPNFSSIDQFQADNSTPQFTWLGLVGQWQNGTPSSIRTYTYNSGGFNQGYSDAAPTSTDLQRIATGANDVRAFLAQ